MTPKVQDVLLDARARIYAEVSERFSASDMHALQVISGLLVTDVTTTATLKPSCGA